MFERNKEEDPLAGLRGEGKATKVEVSERGGGGGIGEGPILGLWFLVTVVLATLVLYLSESDAVDDPVKRAERGEVRGFDDDSLLLPENLREALAKVTGREAGGVTENIRLDPTGLTASVRRADFKERYVRVDTSFDVDEGGAGESEDKGGRAADIPVDAPRRIIAAIAKRLNRPVDEQARDIDYMALSFSEVEERIVGSWGIFLGSGRPSLKNWRSNLQGTDVYLSGEPSAADRARRRAQEQISERRTQASERYSACQRVARSIEASNRCSERYQREPSTLARDQARPG